MTRLLLKPIRDEAGATQHRQLLAELPAREALEVPRRKKLAQERREAFREMLEGGRGR